MLKKSVFRDSYSLLRFSLYFGGFQEVAESEMDFAFNLQFSYIPEVQLTVLQKLLHYILSLPEKQSE